VLGSYYNEIDPFCAEWLRNLIAAGHIAPGEVDTRSIEDVRPDDLKGFTQCHFFAGIGVWSYALRRAGWPDDKEVWTGSCPCQPFSAAGKGAGFTDERHLWPAWFHLIAECRPATLFGEQVASKDGLAWLDLVQSDLEGANYSNAAFDLCAASVGAPHIRQRLYFVADSNNKRRRYGEHALLRAENDRWFGAETLPEAAGRGEAGNLGDTDNARPQGRGQRRNRADELSAGSAGVARDVADADEQQRERLRNEWQRRWQEPANRSFWNACDWLPCTDGKARPVEPGTFPLAHGVAGRVGRLRAYGNAIVAPLAEEFIRAYLDAR